MLAIRLGNQRNYFEIVVLSLVCYITGNSIELPISASLCMCEIDFTLLQPEIVREAEVMQELDHKHIVRMIGKYSICPWEIIWAYIMS